MYFILYISASVLDAIDNKVDNCIPQSGYELPSRREETISWGAEYEMRIRE
jgi:hypothetical protein